MPFTLRINFSGSCLFAPQPAADGKPDRMHVLLPSGAGLAEGEHAHHHVERHIPVLQFDAGHLRADPGREPTDVVAQVLIRGATLNLDGDGARLFICPQIASVRDVAQREVLPELFEDDPGGLLAARVTLAAGEMAAVAKGAAWELEPGQPRRRLAHQAFWDIPMEGDELQLALESIAFGGEEPPAVPVLFPFDEDGERVVNVSIRHLPPDELVIDPPKDERLDPVAHHFAMYYPLFGLAEAPLLPQNPVPDPDVEEQGCRELPSRGGTAFNCMLGGGG